MNNKNKKLFNDRLNDFNNSFNLKFIITNIDNSYINSLFDNYLIKEWVEYFYDSEPDYDDEEFKMHMDYLYQNKQIETSGTSIFYTFYNLNDIQDKKEDFKFSENEYTLDELKNAHLKIEQQRQDYENVRLTFNNWIELHTKGNWEATQEQVKEYGLNKALTLYKVYKKDRWAIAENDIEICLFFYGRDVKPKCDYLFCFKKG